MMETDTSTELAEQLGSKTRYELRILAKRLGLRRYSRLRKEPLITYILTSDHAKIRAFLKIQKTWWDKYHAHVNGAVAIATVGLTVLFFMANRHDTAHIAGLLEDELSSQHTLGVLAGLVADPPPASERAKELARLIGSGDPPYAQALKAIVEGRFEEAYTFLAEHRSSTEAELSRIYRFTADTCVFQKKHNAALVWYERALALQPSDVHSMGGAAYCLIALDRIGEGLVYYDQILEYYDDYLLHPQKHALLLGLATTLKESGRSLLAEGKLREARESADRCAQICSRLAEEHGDLELRDSLARLVENTAYLFRDLSRPQEALSLLTRAVEMHRNAVRQRPEEGLRRLANIFISSGQILERMGEYDKALASFDEAITTLGQTNDTEDDACTVNTLAWAYSERANCLKRVERRSDAIESHGKAIGLYRRRLALEDPTVHDTIRLSRNRLYRGCLLDDLGKASEAMRDYDASIDMLASALREKEGVSSRDTRFLQSALAHAYARKGSACFRVRRSFTDAEEAYSRAIEMLTALGTEDSDVWMREGDFARRYYDRGKVLSAMGKHDEALIDFEQAVGLFDSIHRRTPERWTANFLGLSLIGRGHALKAVGDTVRGDGDIKEGRATRAARFDRADETPHQSEGARVAGSGRKPTNECYEGAQECVGDGTRVCYDFNGDGYTEWSPTSECGHGESCIDGECVEERYFKRR